MTRRSRTGFLVQYARIAHASQRHCEPTTYVPSGIHATNKMLELIATEQLMTAWGNAHWEVNYQDWILNQVPKVYMPLGQLSARGSH
eukprot:scaffold11402_cov147-Cylindrotheca_fusiformis.AAC.1